MRQEWLPELTSIVETINASFSTNFAEIGCVVAARWLCELQALFRLQGVNFGRHWREDGRMVARSATTANGSFATNFAEIGCGVGGALVMVSVRGFVPGLAQQQRCWADVSKSGRPALHGDRPCPSFGTDFADIGCDKAVHWSGLVSTAWKQLVAPAVLGSF